jgi:hypothetical protein
MRGVMRRAVVVAGVVLLGPAVGVASAAGAVAGTGLAGGSRVVLAGGWGTAKEVPGTAALNQGGNAQVSSISCASAGNCGAVGFYTDSSGQRQAFAVSQANGTWGTAAVIPGTAALNQGGFAQASSVSCAPAGDCSAGGIYADSSNRTQAFVVSQTNGTWGTAREVPGTATLNQGGVAEINSVSCASAGDCSAGGIYAESSGDQQALVVSQTNGTWGKAKEVPGSAALNTRGAAAIFSVSCASAGNCSAGGGYTDASGVQALAATETNGTWGKAKEIPGTAALNHGPLAQVNSVSCGSAGNCSTVGFYTDSSSHTQAFVAVQKNGIWGTAVEFPGTAGLASGAGANAQSVSCPSAGNCSAGGIYAGSSGTQVFAATQKNGTWGTAKEIPGTATLNKGEIAQINSISCATAGNCSAGGSYSNAALQAQAFIVNQT